MPAAIHTKPADRLGIVMRGLPVFLGFSCLAAPGSVQAADVGAQVFQSPLEELPLGRANEGASKAVMESIRATTESTATAPAQAPVAALPVPVPLAPETMAAGSPAVGYVNGGSIAGNLTRSASGEVTFTTSGNQVLKLKDDPRFSGVPAGYPLAFGIEINPVQEEEARLKISESVGGLRPFSEQYWKNLREYTLSGNQVPDFPEISEAQLKLTEHFNKLMEAARDPAVGQDVVQKLQLELAEKEQAMLEALGNAYAEASSGWVRQWLAKVAALHEVGLKAANGQFIDNYDPEVYETIVTTSRSCGAIQFEGSQKPAVSAAIVGEDLILTCRHYVVENWTGALEDMTPAKRQTLTNPLSVQNGKIQFSTHEIAYFLPDREARKGLGKLPGRKLPVAELLYDGSTEDGKVVLDFAIFRLRPGSLAHYRAELAQEAEKLKRPNLPVEPIRLAPKMPEYYSPLIVVGHPDGDTKLVHDATHLIFPPVINPSILKRMVMALEYSLIDVRSDLQYSRKKEWRDFMGTYYHPIPDKSERRKYRVNNTLPVFGLNSDTFGGDSGGPVVDRMTGNLVGVFRGSAVLYRDEESIPPKAGHNPAGKDASVNHHELATPITEIIDFLDEKTEGHWRETGGISFGTTATP